MPAVYLLKAEVVERDLDALERFAEEDVLAARVGRIALREAGGEKPTFDARSSAVEVVGAPRAPASTAANDLELPCIIIIIIVSISNRQKAQNNIID